MNWKVWMSAGTGMWEMAKDALCQKIVTRHLPSHLRLPDLTALSCIVTGATSGIGLHTARELAMAGAHVVMACRNTRIAVELVQEWQKHATGTPLSIQIMELDLLSLASVRCFGDKWESRRAPLHLLINNAGILQMGAEKLSRDGYEQHMQVNHVAPALLTILLLPSLLRGAPSRIINVNSVAHHCGVVDSQYLDADFRHKNYNSFTAYAASKLSHLMFLGVLSTKLPEKAQLAVIALHPGIVSTNILMGSVPSFRKKSFWKFDAAQGARSVLFCATDAEVGEQAGAGKNGRESVCVYYGYNCKPAKVSAQAAHHNYSFGVWNKTLQLLGVSDESIQAVTVNQIIPTTL